MAVQHGEATFIIRKQADMFHAVVADSEQKHTSMQVKPLKNGIGGRMSMNKHELKPCPICRCRIPYMVTFPFRLLFKYSVECHECDFRIEATITKRGAARKWNRIKIWGDKDREDR